MPRYVRTKIMRRMEAYERAWREEQLRLLEAAIHRQWWERPAGPEREPPNGPVATIWEQDAIRP